MRSYIRIALWAGLLSGSIAFGQVGFGSLAVGMPATLEAVVVPVQTAGTLGSIEVLAGGVQGGDFTAVEAAGSTCAVGSFYSAGQTCSVEVAFAPAYPGLRIGAVVLLSDSGSVLATEYLSGTGLGALGVLVPGAIRTVAGNGQWTAIGDGLSATSAGLFLPASVTVDGAGDLYIADSVHNRIRRVDAGTGVISTIAGNGDAGYGGDNAPAVNAVLNAPGGLALDGAGNIYIADTGNHVIRELTAATGIITTIAGSGTEGYGGDYGPAVLAELNAPSGVTIDARGNIVIADTANQRIRIVDASSRIITTVAGNGVTASTGVGSYSGDGGAATLAGLNFPYAVGFDLAGNMYIPDSGNNRIRMVSATTGRIATVAGGSAKGFAGDHGPATKAKLYAPSGVAFDAAGNLYIADTQNNRIREVNAATKTITTIAGNGTGKYGGDAGSALVAELYGPYCVVADASGNLFIADYFDNRIREISSTATLLTFTPATRVGAVSLPQSQIVENLGNAALTLTAISPDVNAAVDAASTTCSLGGAVGPASTCTVGVEFSPSQAGSIIVGNITLAPAGENAPLNIAVTGQTLALNSSSTQLISSANPSLSGQPVQLLATVTGGDGPPTGSMTFTDGGALLGPPVTLDAAGSATFLLSSATVGPHPIVGTYSGDANHLTGASAVLTQAVDEPTVTTIVSSQNPSPSNASVTVTATVAPSGGNVAPTGTIVFEDGAIAIGSAALSAQGQASFVISGLAAGVHSMTASYAGLSSAYILGSASPPLDQMVQGQTAIAVKSSADPSIDGDNVVFTANLTSTAPNGATGSVSFFDGLQQIGHSNLSASPGNAQISTASIVDSSLSVGAHLIRAVFTGNAESAGSASAVLTQTVEAAATSVQAGSSLNPAVVLSPITISAAVAGGGRVPGGVVVFLDDSTPLGTRKLDATGFASLTSSGLAIGQHQLSVRYLGDLENAPSSSNPVSQVVKAIPTVTTLSSSEGAGPSAQMVLSSTVAGASGPVPTGSVAFHSGATTLGTIPLSSSGTAVFSVTPGSAATSFVAVYPGDPLHGPSSSISLLGSSPASGLELRVNPNLVRLRTTQNIAVTLTLSSDVDLADQIGLGCASLPPLVTCHFSSDSISLQPNGTLTEQLTIDTNAPLSGGSMAVSAGPVATNVKLAGGLLPAELIFCWLLWRVRRRLQAWTRLVCITLISLVALQMTGCGAITQKSAAPGTYVVQVIATGVVSGITQAADLTIDVTR